jgi:hypothetical protein
MTGVIVYLTCVIGLAAALCGHQGEGPPPGVRRAALAVRRHRPARLRLYAHRPRREAS